MSEQIGFIGAGQMATALARGFVRAELVSPADLLAGDPSAPALQRFSEQTGGSTTSDNASVMAQRETVFLAVKPQQVSAVLAGLRGVSMSVEKLVVSIVAGVGSSRLAEQLDGSIRWIRVMPNTPCLLGEGACAYSLGPGATEGDGELVERLLASVGLVFRVEESLLDAVTGLSGSGPALVYGIIEAMSDAGVRAGLPRGVATSLAAQTLKGAARMVLETGEHPGVLKDRVCSPGGTTIAGIEAMEQAGVRGGLMSAVSAAARRSVELG